MHSSCLTHHFKGFGTSNEIPLGIATVLRSIGGLAVRLSATKESGGHGYLFRHFGAAV